MKVVGIALVVWCVASVPAALLCGALIRWASRSDDESVRAATTAAAAARLAAARAEALSADARPDDERPPQRGGFRIAGDTSG